MYGYLQKNFLFEYNRINFGYEKDFQDLQKIQRELTKQGQEHLLISSGSYKSRKYWDYAKNKYQLNENAITRSKEDGKYGAKQYAQLEQEKKLLFQAYEKIQNIRTALTGQELSYRLYATDPNNNGQLGFIDVKANELEKFIKFSDKELSISQNKVLKAIRENKNSQQELKTVSNLYQRITDSEIGKMSIVNSSIQGYSGTYYMFNDGHGKKYTRGHIIEEIDKMIFSGTTSKMAGMSGQDIINFENNAFNKFNSISRDSISGFKGGDNEMVQIKANSARLMRYTSIMYTIDQLLEVGYRMEHAQGFNDRDRIIDQLHQIFSDTSGKNKKNSFSNKDFDNWASNMAEDFKSDYLDEIWGE